MARKKVNKPIIETDKPNGNPVKYWESAKAASDHYNINVVNISYNVNGITKQAKGHYFRFASPKEIEYFSKIIAQIDAPKSAEPDPTDEINDISVSPAPVLPETIQPEENQEDDLSPFARLLEKSKILYNKNQK